MANIHTNFLTGNDATGDGSTALPYKTINKALSVAINGDVVKVAGGELQPIAGATVTVGTRGQNITTSIDLTGQFAIGDIIFFDTVADDGYPMAANSWTINAITSTVITCSSAVHIKAGTYTPYKLSTYHYSAASGTFETFAAPTATDVTVEGGWDATYTTQIGWTGVKTAAATISANFTTTWTFIRPNIVWNKFIFGNINNCLGGSAASIGANELAFSRCNNVFGQSNFGVYAPTSIGYTTIYNVNSTANLAWNGAANRPTTLNLKQWVTATTATGNANTLKFGFAVSEGQATGPSIKTLDAHWRSFGNQTNNSNYSPIFSTSSPGDLYIDNLTLYIGGNNITPICQAQVNTQAWKYIGNLNVVNLDGTRSGITPFLTANTTSQNPVGQIPLHIGKTTGVMEDLPWMNFGSPQLMNTYLNCQNAAAYCKDSQGQKVINSDSIVKYADPIEYVTGNNSLRYKIITNTAATHIYNYFCGILDKPSTAKTITIKIKASKAITIESIGVQYGMAGSTATNLTPSTTSITTSWQDITCTIDPVGLTGWDIASDGLIKTFIRISSTEIADQNEVAYLYVDSVTIS